MALSPRYTDALALACELHRDQTRKGTPIPYLAHLLAVSALALEHGATEDEAIAALLHDAVEDQGGLPTEARIRTQFGDAVADIVMGCTDAVVIPKPPWRERKEQYIAHLAHASPSILLVSACDKLHNARAILGDYRTLGEALWPRFSGGRDGTLWYYRTLVAAFGARIPAALAIDLSLTVSTLDSLAR
jgi:(p)ppGpp synthase/HD superfamily hydrolase